MIALRAAALRWRNPLRDDWRDVPWHVFTLAPGRSSAQALCIPSFRSGNSEFCDRQSLVGLARVQALLWRVIIPLLVSDWGG